jgi:glycosyltransferase involved in cell wall biosynthesis
MSFSVVIPAFNAEKTIARALQSCMNQTLAPVEIIVVDDASRDQTIKIAEGFGERVRIIRLTQNQGVAFARNTGWDAATGDYITFLDSDDEWYADKLKILDFYIKKQTGLSIIFHSYTLNDFTRQANWKQVKPQKYSFGKILVSNPVQSSCLCILRKIGTRFDIRFRYCEDHELMLRLAFQHACYRIPLRLTRLYSPQLLGQGLSGNLWKMRSGEMNMYCRIGRLSPLFLPLIPFLLLFSLIKHISKWIAVKSGLEYQIRKRH